MIVKLEVENYRCYHNNTFEGFKKVNLIGGLNNAGKTILLEALLLNAAPTIQTISLLRQLRGDLDTSMPEYAWDGLFYNLDKTSKIIISATHEDDNRVSLTISTDERVDAFKSELEKDDDDLDNVGVIMNEFITNERSVKSVLHLKRNSEGGEVPVLEVLAHKKGITAKEVNIPYESASFIPASMKVKSQYLAKEYSKIEKLGNEGKVLEALQIVDEKIEAIKISLVGGTLLEIKRKDESFMPLSYFGDAINKIANIAIHIINNSGSVLLIDEIENGLHYTVHKEFWRYIFNLASKFDVQVFATTHSGEMISSFSEILKDESFASDGVYLELFRSKFTNSIDYNLHDGKTLSYELANRLTVRGE